MHQVRITALRQTVYSDLVNQFENPILLPCTIQPGQQWISIDGKCPDGMCASAWLSMKEFVQSLAHGKGHFYDGWMRNPMSAMVSCNDGFRPMSFYLELIDEHIPLADLTDLVSARTVTSAPAPTPSRPSASQPSTMAQPIKKAEPKDRSQERLHKLLLAIGDQTMPRRQIIAYLDLKQNSRRVFTDNYLKPAIAQGYVVMARPSSPNSPEQAYRLSTDGLEIWTQLQSTSQEDSKNNCL